jgi:hypothetical protein
MEEERAATRDDTKVRGSRAIITAPGGCVGLGIQTLASFGSGTVLQKKDSSEDGKVTTDVVDVPFL